MAELGDVPRILSQNIFHALIFSRWNKMALSNELNARNISFSVWSDSWMEKPIKIWESKLNSIFIWISSAVPGRRAVVNILHDGTCSTDGSFRFFYCLRMAVLLLLDFTDDPTEEKAWSLLI